VRSARCRDSAAVVRHAPSDRAPKHPATRATREAVEEAESRLPIEEMVNGAVEQAELEQFCFPTAPASHDP